MGNNFIPLEKAAALKRMSLSKIRAGIRAGWIIADRSGPNRSLAVDSDSIPDPEYRPGDDPNEVTGSDEPLNVGPFRPPPPENHAGPSYEPRPFKKF